jgi:hypothetical protein
VRALLVLWRRCWSAVGWSVRRCCRRALCHRRSLCQQSLREEGAFWRVNLQQTLPTLKRPTTTGRASNTATERRASGQPRRAIRRVSVHSPAHMRRRQRRMRRAERTDRHRRLLLQLGWHVQRRAALRFFSQQVCVCVERRRWQRVQRRRAVCWPDAVVCGQRQRLYRHVPLDVARLLCAGRARLPVQRRRHVRRGRRQVRG